MFYLDPTPYFIERDGEHFYVEDYPSEAEFRQAYANVWEASDPSRSSDAMLNGEFPYDEAFDPFQF